MKIRTLLKKINPMVPQDRLKYSRELKAFISKYELRNADSLNWIELCADVRKYNCYRYGLALLVAVLEKHLYHGQYTEYLYPLLPSLKELAEQHSTSYCKIFCGDDIRYLVICGRPDHGDSRHTFVYVKTENRFVINILAKFYENQIHFADVPSGVCSLFGESLEKSENKVFNVNDFTENTLFLQLDFYKSRFSNDPRAKKAGIFLVLQFYRWLVSTYPELDFFAGSFHISERLLYNSGLPNLVAKNYYFTTLNPTNVPYGNERICLIMKGLDRQSTRITNDDFVSLDLSTLKSEFYRDLLIEYTVTSTSAASIKWVGIAYYIAEAMQNLFVVKQNPSYPNKDLRYLSNQEAVFIRQYFDQKPTAYSTKNNKIGAVRRYLQFCVDKKAIVVDDLFFNYLTQYEEPNKSTAKTVPDDDLVKLHNYFVEKGKTDVYYQEMLVIFHLLLQTEFRVSQICHLPVNCIRPTIKPDQYEIMSISKTSHGRKESSAISGMTYNLLMDIIEKTEAVREECPIESMKQYIFVYTRPSRRNNASLYSDRIFGGNMRTACKELGINRWSASNLRDTHMTKALEHIMRNGKSDMEMSVLSKHRHMDTTKNHYIEMELEKMLESTYGITIGSDLVQADSKVVNTIPKELQGSENDVEHGCGKCSADKCVMTNSLPCLACKHFITTVQHEAFFKKAIENTEQAIKAAKNPHDKEDLITVKELYVLYLKAIIKKQEETENDD